MSQGNLGLTVNVADIPDPEKFRREFLWGSVAQAAAQYGDFVAAASRWVKAPVSFPAPKTPAEAKELIESLLRGNLPDETVRAHILMQMDRLATRIGTRLEVRRVAMGPLDEDSDPYDVVRDRVPFVLSDGVAYTRIIVPGPILAVNRIRFVADNVAQWTVPIDIVTVADRRMGVITLPGYDAFPYASPLATSRGASNLFASALRFNDIATRPGVWAVDYLTGPSVDNRAGQVPLAVVREVYCQAALSLLGMSSNALTKGVASQSRSADGVTYSISLQTSAMYDIYSALEVIYEKMSEKLPVAVLQRRMVGIRCAPL